MSRPIKRIPRSWLLAIPGFDPFRCGNQWQFDHKAAAFAIAFFEEFLIHTTGELAGRPFTLEKWQKGLVANLIGWKHRKTRRRRFRECFLELPRGNGKTKLASGLALLLLYCDNAQGANIYDAAASSDQATICYQESATCVESHPWLAQRSRVMKRQIENEQLKSVLRVLPANALTLHGLRPRAAFVDEVHAIKDREIVDALRTAAGKDPSSLMMYLTTAGWDRSSVCFEIYDYACQVRDGVIEDDRFLPAIWEASPEDDWTSAETWKKANPNYGISIEEDYFPREVAKAQASPALQNVFRRLHLNIWTSQDARWLDPEQWARCSRPMPWLFGRPCWGGLDMSSTTDLTAFSLVFRPEDDAEPWSWLVWHFVPADRVERRAKVDRVPYDIWRDQGWILATEGAVVDHRVVRETIVELGELFDIRQIGVDRWNASQIVSELDDAGFEIVQHGQGFASMSGPTKELEKLYESARISHGENPVLTWQANHVSALQDPAGNLKPDKASSRDRIDGIVSGVMAIGLATMAPADVDAAEEWFEL